MPQKLLELPEIKATCWKVTFKKITELYDGYTVPSSILKIFSSWLVLNLSQPIPSIFQLSENLPN